MSKGELPLIALVNSKSGGQDGPKLIKKLLEHISKENVFDLADGGPAVGLATCKNQRTKVLVCGGDGTVAWVLSEIKKLDFDDKLRPVVAILPLGTANDLSRTLKWGPGWAGEKLSPLISQIDKASVVHMDQWHVVSSGNGDNEEKLYVMNNYFSVGSDAEVALKFHKKREKKPTLFKNRTLNKGFYAKYAVGTFLRAQPLSASLDVELDGVKIEIPNNISVLLVLNTPSYASGMNPWGAASKKKKHLTHQTIDDGKFEVVGIKGLLHAGGLQMRMVKGKKLGQGAALTIKTNRPMAAQVDGEPWLQEPAVIKITHGGHALMLANSPPNAKKAEKAEAQPAPSATVISLSLEGEPPSPSKQRPVSRTYSSNTISTINYGPVPATKRRKNRYYCDICDFEFFLPYMLDNHKVQGCKGNLASSSSSSSSSDSVYAQPSSLSHAASAPVTSNNKHESSEDSESETSVVSVLLRITEEAEVEVESQEESFPDKAAIDQTSPDRCLSSPDKPSDANDFALAEKATSEPSGEASTPASNEPASVTEDLIPEKEEKEEKKDEEKEDEKQDASAAEEVVAKTEEASTTEALATTEEVAEPVTEEAPAKEESSTTTEEVATPVKAEEVATVSDEAATPVKEDTPAEAPVTDKAATTVQEDIPAEATPVAAETTEVVASSKPEPVEEESKESEAPEDDASSSSSSSSSSSDDSSSSSSDDEENDKEEPTEESKEVDEAVPTGTQEGEPVAKDNIEESPKAQNEDATNSTEQSNGTTSDTPLDEEKHEQKLNGHTNEDSETTTEQIAEENADHSESKSDTTKETKESEQNAEVVESEPKPKKKEVVVWPLFQQRMRA